MKRRILTTMNKSDLDKLLDNKDIPSMEKQVETSEVKENDKKETKKIWTCPYCENTIEEKELFFDEEMEKWFHRPCMDDGAIKLPDKLQNKPGQEIAINPFGSDDKRFTEKQTRQIKENLDEFLNKEESRWMNLVNSFGIGPLQDNVAGVTRFEVHPTQRFVEVILDGELVRRAPNIIVAGVLAHELKHVNQVKSGKINRLENRAEIEEGAFQHERRFFLRHREKFDGKMRAVIDERISQIDQIITAYHEGEMMLLAKDVQIGFKK
jgi:hypothetical protein